MSVEDELKDAYTIAEARWINGLYERFGILAQEARYTSAGYGEPGSRLKALYELKELARIAYETHTGGAL